MVWPVSAVREQISWPRQEAEVQSGMRRNSVAPLVVKE